MLKQTMSSEEEELKIALLKLEFIITGNKIKKTQYMLKEAKKKPKDDFDDDFDYIKELGYISKNLGGGILDIKKTTIHQYLTAKEALKNG